MVIEHVLKSSEETEAGSPQPVAETSTALESIELETTSQDSLSLVKSVELEPEKLESIALVQEDPTNLTESVAESAYSIPNPEPVLARTQPLAPEPEASPQTNPETRDDHQPVSQAQMMLEKWFRALDNTIDTTTNHYSVGERSYAEDLAENPGELLKQLEKIARSSDPIPTESKKPQSTFRKQPEQPCHVPMAAGRRKEVYSNGALVIKDALGKVMAVRSRDHVSITFNYDQNGNLKSFSRYLASGALHSTGERDRHGVIVRDPCGRVRAQGESMSCDPGGCLTIRKMDGQFWSLDLVRGIHIERRILEDLDGHWSSLTALLTFDGFRMATRFQELKDSYRRYGDWLSQSNSSTFRFYGRDGSMIQFNSDEELQSLRPSSMKPPGSKYIDEELKGRRKARTAWDSVHEYVSQYLAIL